MRIGSRLGLDTHINTINLLDMYKFLINLGTEGNSHMMMISVSMGQGHSVRVLSGKPQTSVPSYIIHKTTARFLLAAW